MIEKDIVDRVPTYPGRIKLTPVSGQADVFTMERKDEPTIPGTPIDKATLDSIIKSRLSGRYYVPTVQRAILSSQTGLTVNPISKSGWQVASLTRATNGEYVITASSSLNNSYGLERATDGNQNTTWTSKGYVNSAGEWWQIQLPTPIAVTAIKVNLEDLSGYGQAFSFQGSNNGTSWTELTSGTFGRLTGMTTYEFTNSTQYSYYRMYFTGYEEYSATIVEFEIARYNVATYKNLFTIASGVPLQWTTGQRITIQTPTSVTTAATMENDLNGKKINTVLQPSRKYELVYNGTSFDAKEV